jgi:hypothetical protein
VKLRVLVLAGIAGAISLGCAVAADDGLGSWTDSTHDLEVTSPDPANPVGGDEPGSADDYGAKQSSGPGKPTPDPWNEVYVLDKPTPDPWEGSGSGGGNGSEDDEEKESSSSPSEAPGSGDRTR